MAASLRACTPATNPESRPMSSSVNAEANSATDPSSANAAVPSGGDRRERLQGTINSLVALRRDVVTHYCRLAGIGSFDERDSARLRAEPTELVRFCETMVDYTAMGHFEVYQRIMEGQERRQAVKDTADDVYPAIAETTDWLVDFNDSHETFEGSAEETAALTGELRKLGEIIALRSLLEDQLLDALRR